MKYIINNKKPKDGEFIRVPKSCFTIKNKTAFFLYIWLINHKDGFEMNEYFVKKGTGMDYRTFRKYLEILQDNGKLKFSTDTNSNLVHILLVYILSTRTNKQELKKQEEKKKQEYKQEEVPSTGVPPAQGTAIGVVNEFDEI